MNRNQIAAKMGLKPQAVARALGEAQSEGIIVKVEGKGYQKAI
jgi:predicted transcriptional regulator